MTCTLLAGETRPRRLFEWEPPAGVTIEQDFERTSTDTYGRRVVVVRFVAVCRCELRTPAMALRCDAITELAEMHRGAA